MDAASPPSGSRISSAGTPAWAPPRRRRAIRRLAAAKSLLSFAQRVGYLQLNPGAALQLERATETENERILSAEDVRRMIAAEPDARRRALLRLLYVCGLRASEAAGLRWRDMTGSEKKGGAARVLGKGGKLRQVEVPASLWRELAALAPAGAKPEAAVIPGAAGGVIDRKVVHRVVKRGGAPRGRDGRRLGALAPAQPCEPRPRRRLPRPRPAAAAGPRLAADHHPLRPRPQGRGLVVVPGEVDAYECEGCPAAQSDRLPIARVMASRIARRDRRARWRKRARLDVRLQPPVSNSVRDLHRSAQLGGDALPCGNAQFDRHWRSRRLALRAARR